MKASDFWIKSGWVEVMRKLLITGNLGYIGPVVSAHFRKHGLCEQIVGMDRGFFEHLITVPATDMLNYAADLQIYADVRCPMPEMFTGVDTVIHLAALSNDPIGKEYEKITKEINADGTLKVAQMAKEQGVKHFVFASSCSVYGCAENIRRHEDSDLDPLTAYARSKVASEKGLKKLAADHFIVTCHRFGTACGMSPRLRLDLVLNDFVASIMTTGRIEILSDGSPWRPLIDVEDMARAMAWSSGRTCDVGGKYCVVNTGSNVWNYQIKDLAHAVKACFPQADIDINENADPDKRSYQVDFGLFEKLAPQHQPLISIKECIKRLRSGLKNVKFGDSDFRNSELIRLEAFRELREQGLIDAELWPIDVPPHLSSGSV